MHYIGNSALSLDTKGRMMIPTKYRDALMTQCEGQLYLTRSPEGCLLLLPLPVWTQMSTEIAQWPAALNPWRRIYFANATAVTWDGSGRILIPPELREKAQLDKDVELLGNGSHFELWNKAVNAQLEAQALAGEVPELIRGFSF